MILVDAANAFNNINRKALLHNVKVLCPIFACYVNNCYRSPARLFVIGGIELKSNEGTTQGDPIGMAVYAIGITPLLNMLLSNMTLLKRSKILRMRLSLNCKMKTYL